MSTLELLMLCSSICLSLGWLYHLLGQCYDKMAFYAPFPLVLSKYSELAKQ
jgi:hypothetical protein